MIGRWLADLIKASGHHAALTGRMDGSSQDRHAKTSHQSPCNAGGVHGWTTRRKFGPQRLTPGCRRVLPSQPSDRPNPSVHGAKGARVLWHTRCGSSRSGSGPWWGSRGEWRRNAAGWRIFAPFLRRAARPRSERGNRNCSRGRPVPGVGVEPRRGGGAGNTAAAPCVPPADTRQALAVPARDPRPSRLRA
jgi:hypothetical protein